MRGEYVPKITETFSSRQNNMTSTLLRNTIISYFEPDVEIPPLLRMHDKNGQKHKKMYLNINR